MTVASPTTDPYGTKILITKDKNIIFTFYTDQPFFHMRNLTNSATFAVNYNSPIVVNLLTGFFATACLNEDDTILYMLTDSGYILAYRVSDQVPLTIQFWGANNLESCYIDNTVNRLLLIYTTYNSLNTGYSYAI